MAITHDLANRDFHRDPFNSECCQRRTCVPAQLQRRAAELLDRGFEAVLSRVLPGGFARRGVARCPPLRVGGRATTRPQLYSMLQRWPE
eukprot:1485759-Prymnesium_polylepis.1